MDATKLEPYGFCTSQNVHSVIWQRGLKLDIAVTEGATSGIAGSVVN
jgi:hypothetical protein